MGAGARRAPTQNATKYVLIFGVGMNLIFFLAGLPSCGATIVTFVSGMFENAVRSPTTIRLRSNTALAAGSSTHGKQRRASRASNWVEAMTRFSPLIAV